MLHIGIDEAGYGPLLGPLVLGASAFHMGASDLDARIADDFSDDELESRLAGIVIRPAAGSKKRDFEPPLPVPIDDSKKIFRRFGLVGLSRAVGAFSAALDTPPPASLLDLLHRYSAVPPVSFALLPWYTSMDEARLPRYPWTGPLTARFSARSVQALDLVALPVPVPAYNESVGALGSKARVLGMFCGHLILSILDREPHEDAEITIDRHGSRVHYEEFLEALFPDGSVEVMLKERIESRYLVSLPGRRLVVRIMTGADARSMAVSWASLMAKLARELFMERISSYFAEHVDGLHPTSGYWVDGQRFLRDIKPVTDVEDPAMLRSLVRLR